MPEITRRRTGVLLRTLFEVLIPSPEGMAARDALAAVESKTTLTDFERGDFPSGGRRFDKIIRFATVDCVKAGWLQKAKGRWMVTDAGKSAYAQYVDPEAFCKQAIKLYREWKASQPDSTATAEEEPSANAMGGTTASISFEEAEEQAWSEIAAYLRKIQPYDFQDLVAALLRAMGYHVSWVAPPGKDGGVDIVAWNDPLGTRPPRIKVQVKRQKESVNIDGLRAFMAMLGEDDVGLFVSTSGFTKDAADAARTQEKRKVTLIDLERLFDLWVEHYIRLSDDARRRMPLRPIYFLSPDT